MNEYMIMLRGSFQSWGELTADEKSEIKIKYYDWVAKLQADKLIVGGCALESDSKYIKLENKETVVSESPYKGTDKSPTGYFIINAENLEAATETAKGCPALMHGDHLEIMPLAAGE